MKVLEVVMAMVIISILVFSTAMAVTSFMEESFSRDFGISLEDAYIQRDECELVLTREQKCVILFAPEGEDKT